MRTQTIEKNVTGAEPTESFSYSSSVSYHEMADIPVREVDALEQLRSNMDTLADLQARMNFMMREIRYLMKV